MSFGFSSIQGRTKDWQAVFFLGIAGVVIALYNAPWHWPFGGTAKTMPFVPAVVPPPHVAPALQPMPTLIPAPSAPVTAKIIQSLPPATFAPQISPTSIPELEGIERPAPAKKVPQPEFGTQNGYVESTDQQPLNVR